ncbi:MAG: hypothetical protein ABI780_04980 [Ardenticatenales bacterium]
MNGLSHLLDRRRTGALLLAVVCGAALGVTAGHASAAKAPKPVPIAGAWCGVTDSGGSVHFDVSADGRFVGGLTVREANSGISGSEGIVNPTTGIADGMFIFRRDRDEYHCETRGRPQDPPRPSNPPRCFRPPCPPANCDVIRVNEIMIRGTFDTSDAAHGTFTYLNGNRRETGRYNAWPASVAPCTP